MRTCTNAITEKKKKEHQCRPRRHSKKYTETQRSSAASRKIGRELQYSEEAMIPNQSEGHLARAHCMSHECGCLCEGGLSRPKGSQTVTESPKLTAS